MKKRKCKQYLKLVMLLFGVTFVLSSCQIDELNAGLNIYKATGLTFIEYQKLEIVNNEVISNPCN